MTENLRPKRIVSCNGDSATAEVFTRFTITCGEMPSGTDGLSAQNAVPIEPKPNIQKWFPVRRCFIICGTVRNFLTEWKAHIFGRYPVLHILDRCVREFRDMFRHQCLCRLHCFIERYAVCGIAPLESFAKGLLNDLEAVEYAVSSDWSNGLVEGTNNRLKTVKRMMYGRCGRQLLEAKMLL